MMFVYDYNYTKNLITMLRFVDFLKFLVKFSISPIIPSKLRNIFVNILQRFESINVSFFSFKKKQLFIYSKT